MTKFEEFLISKGYVRHSISKKKGKYVIEESTGKHVFSTMGDIFYSYIHPEVDLFPDHVDNWFRRIDVGLHEVGKPATLISPRPRIRVSRSEEQEEYMMDESWDDNMNVVLMNVDHEKVYEAMFDRSILLEVKLETK